MTMTPSAAREERKDVLVGTIAEDEQASCQRARTGFGAQTAHA
jgi:hypothetical protein